jgi:hypothetical protein
MDTTPSSFKQTLTRSILRANQGEYGPRVSKVSLRNQVVWLLKQISSEIKPNHLPNIQVFTKVLRSNILAYLLVKYDQDRLDLISNQVNSNEIAALMSYVKTR